MLISVNLIFSPIFPLEKARFLPFLPPFLLKYVIFSFFFLKITKEIPPYLLVPDYFRNFACSIPHLFK